MPILDLQKKMAETGRIRMGEKRVSKKSGKEYPAKLDTFRLTSKNRHVIDDAAAVYGGTAEAFNDNQWAVTTTTKVLEVVVPPGEMSFSQWNEMWGNGFCARRCDGRTELNSDGPCQCPADPAERAALAAKGKACKATTRLSVMLPDLTGVGLWRLESHGFYAATELAGAIEVIQSLAPGTLVRARLSAEERSVVRFDSDGKPQTQTFIVPVLDLADVRLSELMAPSGDGVSVQIETRASGLSAVPALPEGPRPSVAEQLGQEREAPKRRSNAAAELPATGLRPPGGGVEEDVEDADEAAGPGPADPDPADPAALPDGWQARNRKLQAHVHELWKGDSDSSIDERRKVLVGMASDGRTRSSKDLSDEEWELVFTTVEDLAAGRVELAQRVPEGYELRPVMGGRATPRSAAPDGLTAPTDAEGWRDLCKRAGLAQRAVLEEAWRLTGSKGTPSSLADLATHEVAGDVLAWVHAQAAA